MRENRRSQVVIVCVAALLVTAPCLAQTGDEPGGGLDEDLLSPEEQAELERERMRRAQPVLSCLPGRLRARVTKGETDSLQLTVRNAGGQMLSWSIRSVPDWVTVDVRGGGLGFGQERSLTLLVDPEELDPGTVEGQIEVEAPGAKGSPATIPIVLEIQAGPEPTPEESAPSRRRRRRFGGAGAREDTLPDRPVKGEKVTMGAPRGFGVRLGYIGPGEGGDEVFSGGPIYGLYYRAGRNESRLGLEFGFDLASSDSESSKAGTSFIMLSASAVYGLNASSSFYVLGGGKIVNEKVEDGGFDTTDSSVGGTVDLGAGVALAKGKVDVRAAYSFLLGSGNVPGAATVTMGYTF